MKFPPSLVGLTLAALLLTGSCASFHSSSIAGYEALPTPIPEPGKGSVSVGGKLSRLGGIFTQDNTLFVQGALQATLPVLGGEGAGLVLGLGASAYGAQTSVYDIPVSSRADGPHQVYGGTGVVAHLRPSLVFSGQAASFSLSADAAFNREWGEYAQFREGFATQAAGGTQRVDLSPHQTSATALGEFNLQWKVGSQDVVGLGLGLGQVFFDWPARGEGTMSSRVTLLYQRGPLWIWGSWQSVEWLNAGTSIGVGYALR